MSLTRELLQRHSAQDSVPGSPIFVAQVIKGTSLRKPLGQWLQSHTKEDEVAAGSTVSDLKYDYQSR